MHHKLTRTIVVACLTLAAFCLLNPVHAAEKQPKMDKAIELLEQAKTAKNPVAVLQKAKTHVESAPANKGGRRVQAIKAIDDAIALSSNGGAAGAKIDEAIMLLQEGKEKAR